jgi:acetoacetyl-CoA reductase
LREKNPPASKEKTKMTKRKALVSGGMGGIGTAICRALHSQGCEVVTTYVRNSGRQEKWLAARREEGFDNIRAYYCNVGEWDDCVKLKEKIAAEVGTIDIIVNCGGITRDATFRRMTADMWNEVIRINLTGAFNLTRQFIDEMVGQGFGRIVNISSINAQKGQFGQVNYSAAKAGLHGFTKALAQEVVKKGVTVNTVSPGYIGTDMVMKIADDVREKIQAQIPVGRFGEPSEIARVVAFLAADESGFITGADFSANGGQYMH